MCLQECRPCRPLASLGRWLDATALQYIGHSPTTDTVAEVGQRPLNPRVSPTRIVLRHAHNQSGDLLHDPWPPRPMPVREIPFLGDQPSVPAQQSIGRNDRVQFEQHLRPLPWLFAPALFLGRAERLELFFQRGDFERRLARKRPAALGEAIAALKEKLAIGHVITPAISRSSSHALNQSRIWAAMIIRCTSDVP